MPAFRAWPTIARSVSGGHRPFDAIFDGGFYGSGTPVRKTHGEAEMKNRFVLIGSVVMLLLAACATLHGGGPRAGGGFAFALIGDIPYDARHEREFTNVMKNIDSADLAFVVHNGDFWWDGQ